MALRRYLSLHNQCPPKRTKAVSFAVFERDQSFDARRQGYGLTIQQGSRSLNELRLSDAMEAEDTPNDVHYTFTPNGALQSAYGRAAYALQERQKVSPSKQKVGNLHVTRQRLRELLYRGPGEDHDMPVETVHWGWVFCRVERRLVVAEDTEEVGCGAQEIGHQRQLSVHMTNLKGDETMVVTCSVLVGADGIYSAVRRDLLTEHIPTGHLDSMQYLGMAVVLGMCPIGDHYLYRKTTWQSVGSVDSHSCRAGAAEGSSAAVVWEKDGSTLNRAAPWNRLYAMPFSETELFWQLSFPVPLAEAQLLQKMSFVELVEYLLCDRGLAAWHDPITEMLRSTPQDRFMMVPVYDRQDSYPFLGKVFERSHKAGGQYQETGSMAHSCDTARPQLLLESRVPVTLVGDAAHPLSPFKGQGANLALLDGVDLGQAVVGAFAAADVVGALPDALRKCEEKMYDRAQRKVQESRSVAHRLHNVSVDGGTDHLNQSTASGETPAQHGTHSATFQRGLSDNIMRAFEEAQLGTWHSGEEVLFRVQQIYAATKIHGTALTCLPV